MKKMNAFCLVKYGPAETAFEKRQVDRPIPKENEVLIEAEGFGLNFADVLARLGKYPDAPPNPAILGYEVVGKVSSMGGQVFGFKIGDRILAMTRFGSYAEFAVADQRACVKISAETSIASACALATQFCTAYYMLEKKMRIVAGEKVLVHSGAGGVGSALIQLAKIRKAFVITTVGSEEKITVAKNIGADEVINYRTHDFKTEIENRHGKKSVMAAFDAVGGKSFRDSMALLSPAGSVVCYGVSESTDSSGGPLISALKMLFSFGIISPPLLLLRGHSVLGANMLKVADYRPLLLKEILGEVVQLFEKKQITPLVGENQGLFPIGDLAKAHNRLEHRKTIGKIAISF